MDSRFSCLPVTALHVCCVGNQDRLLAGQGGTIRIYNCGRKESLLECRVFESQVIHGISSQLALSKDGDATTTQVLLWAGSAAAVLFLQAVKNGSLGGGQENLLVVTDVFNVELTTWGLFGDFFDHGLSKFLTAFIVTAHNEIHELSITEDSVAGSRVVSCSKLVSGPGCALYSAHARRCSSGLLVAAGTVFGEVVVWSADQDRRSGLWSTTARNVFLGHKGSIFGIFLSEDVTSNGLRSQMLATCSDDRTIRLWNLEDDVPALVSIGTNNTTPVQLSDVTGFSEGDSSATWLLAMAWGHLSRIWNVKFLPVAASRGTKDVKLISTGEDATSHLWEVALDGKTNEVRPAQLRNTCTYGVHSGKNIWSSELHSSQDKHTHYTGAADGSVVATTLQNHLNAAVRNGDFRLHMPFGEISYKSEFEGRVKTSDRPARSCSLKQYALIDDECILATTAGSELIHGKVQKDHKGIVWQHTYAINSGSPILLCSDRMTGSAFFRGAYGSLCAIRKGSTSVVPSSIAVDPQVTFICVASREDSELPRSQSSSVLIPLVHKRSAMLACVSVAKTVILEGRFDLRLPPNFVPTSASHHVEAGVLLLGSRTGAIAIFSNLRSAELTEPIGPAIVFPNLHGSDTVTSILCLSMKSPAFRQPKDRSLFFLTTGRDGTYSIHEIFQFSNTLELSKALKLQTIHSSALPIGPNIEGAYLIKPARGETQELMIFGFRSKDFVVWNETRAIEVLSVDCGGAHRSWAYASPQDSKSGLYMGGNFVWTKAGVCNFYNKVSVNYHVIQSGGHGREIKALAVSPVRLTMDNLSVQDAILIATGAEDTTIRLFVASHGVDTYATAAPTARKLTSIRVLSKHTTGINHLEFSSCAKYLFSSGGCEELCVWRLHTGVPVIGIGIVLECMLPKTDLDADARITAFTTNSKNNAIPEAKSANVDFSIMATYSNGKVKIFDYLCERTDCKATFTLRQEIVQGSFCLTQIHDVYTRAAKYAMVLTAGTNGIVNIHDCDGQSLVTRHRIHQSSIKASILVEIHSSLLLITGGDDNALGLTVISSGEPCADEHTLICRTLLIPSAHAAAVTAVVLLSRATTEDGEERVDFASVSNDQRVKVWRVIVHAGGSSDAPQKELKMQHIEVEKIMECWTGVADAAAVEILSSPPHYDQSLGTDINGEVEDLYHELLVAGVGMEIIKVPYRR